ncbi:hypothetical protein EHF36_10350 [Kerstersia gyiorum]|uniref:hypothetical protein n=1 Tax=Kerstersia gyiorum TaxID=206506 RepID=UPI001070E33C|nr:hypothetical protein [Kerstersia gyiorum]QBR40985.1 hypothetical protein EHF36_10350 [Kerstersia gyiorum]
MPTPSDVQKTTPIPFVDSADKIHVVRVNDASVALVFQRDVADQVDNGFALKRKNIASIIVPIAAMERALEILKAPPADAAANTDTDSQDAKAA